MTAANILVIDDEPGIRNLLSSELARQGYRVLTASNGAEALEMIGREKYQVALCDLKMPGMSGLELLGAIRQRDPGVEVIVLTGYATVETAVAAMKKGAYDFVQKPFNLDEILVLVEKSIEKSGLKTVIQELKEAKRKLEETQIQLIQSEKMAGIGQLAAGVAHELNNPLSGVIGFTQLLLEEKGLTPQQREDLQTVLTQSQRCRTIIQNLLQFSRPKESRKEPLDIARVMQSTLELVDYDFSTSGIDLVFDCPGNLPKVMGDAGMLQQVFVNLLTNARQALEGREQPQLTIRMGAQEGIVAIQFKDNGPGISQEILGKVFDPFFTTKAPGKGTGLGLSICHTIMRQHQGKISVESELGVGTTFTLELPFYHPDHEPAKEHSHS
jgi:signal transduction histidine kinase